MAALAAARLQLFNASQRREAVMLRKVRLEAPETLDSLNADISGARTAVDKATADVQTALAAAPPPVPGPPVIPGPPSEGDMAISAVMALRDSLKSLGP